MRQRVPIGLALTGSFGALLLCAAGVVFALSFSTGYQNTIALLQDKTRLILELVAQRVSQQLDPARKQVEYMAELVRDGHLDVDDRAMLDAALRVSLAAAPQVESAVYIDPQLQGLILARVPGRGIIAIDRDWSNTEQHKYALERGERADEAYWGPIVHVPDMAGSGQGTLVNVRMPVRVDDEFLGMFVASVEVDELSRILAGMSLRGHETIFILSGREQVIAHPEMVDGVWERSFEQPLYSIAEIDDPVLARIWDERYSEHVQLSEDTPSTEMDLYVVDAGEESFVVALQWVYRYSEVPWLLGVHFPRDEIAAEYAAMVAAGSTSFLVILGAVGVVFIIGQRISRPVKQLALAAGELQRNGPTDVEPVQGSRLAELDAANMAFNEMLIGMRQREILRDSFGKFVPQAIADEYLHGEGVLEPVTRTATILFTDIEGFSTIAERMSPRALIELLNDYFAALIAPIEAHGGVIHQFQGDAILATFNLPVEDPAHAANAIRAALAIDALDPGAFTGAAELRTRIGVNTGDVVGGTVGGTGRLGYTVHGDAVNVAARIEQLNKQFSTYLLVAESTMVLCADEFEFAEVSTTEVRGRSAPIRVYSPRLCESSPQSPA